MREQRQQQQQRTKKKKNESEERFFVSIDDTRHLSINIEQCKQFCKVQYFEFAPEKELGMFADLVELMRGIIHFEHARKRDLMRSAFDRASGKEQRKKVVEDDDDCCVGVRDNRAIEHEVQAVSFVSQFCAMMALAEFTLLSDSEWELAMEEDFMFRLPMTIDWSQYDASLLRKFLERNGGLRIGLPKFCERALVFKRGVAVSKHEGLFVREKIDLLIEYLLKRPVMRVLGLGGGSDVGNNNNDDNVKKKLQQQRSQVKNQSKIERKTLRRLMPTIMSVIKNIHKKLELSEPTYKEVIILYRENKMDENEAQFLNIPSGAGPLRLKSFSNVPMADLEMIFPGVKIQGKFMDYLSNGITVLLVILGLIWSFITGEALSERGMQLLTVAGGKLSASFANVNKAKAMYAAQMSQEVIKKMDSSGFAVLSSVVQDMEEQETKEMILAYAAMKGNKSGMTIKELDEKLETALMDRFGLKVDFDVHGSVEKLVEEGLVSKIPGDSGMYQVVSLEKALKKLDKKWDGLFDYSPSSGTTSKGKRAENNASSSEKTFSVSEDEFKMERDLMLLLSNADTERGKEAMKLTHKLNELNEKIADASVSMKKLNWRYS